MASKEVELQISGCRDRSIEEKSREIVVDFYAYGIDDYGIAYNRRGGMKTNDIVRYDRPRTQLERLCTCKYIPYQRARIKRFL